MIRTNVTRILLAAVLLSLPLTGARADEPTAAWSPPPPPALLGQESSLGLRDAIDLALDNNLELEVARADPAIAREQVTQAHGAFDPLGFVDGTFEQRETPIASPVQSAFALNVVTQINEDYWNYQSGFSGVLPMGLEYSSAYEFARSDSSSSFTALDKEYRPAWHSEVTLPLLKDLIYNQSNVTVKRSRIAQDISDEEFRATLMDLIVQIQERYWSLAARRASSTVADKSLKTAVDLLELTRVQYEVGVVSRVNVTQAEAGVAEREVTSIRAENAASNAQDELLDAIAVPDVGQYSTTVILTEDPSFLEYQVDVGEAVRRALELRPELRARRAEVDDAEVALTYAENQRLPRVDLTAGYTIQGIGGPQKSTTVTNLGLETSVRGAHQNFFQADGAHGWLVGTRIEMPIGNTTARHTEYQRRIELRRARTRLKRLEQQIILDVRSSERNLRSSIRAVEAADRRRVAAEETLNAEQERLRLGDSTPHNVLEFEEDVAEARDQEIGALEIYRNSVAGLERAQGTILRTLGISVEDQRVR